MSNESNKRNILTGTTMKKHDDSKELNSFTGISQDVKEDDTNDMRKSDEPKWPSISDIDKRDEEPEPQSESVGKSTDENPWPSLLSHLEGEGFEKVEKAISMHVPVFAKADDKDEHIVYGIVYEPDTVDAQGDKASAEEIQKAAYHFMENNPTFKVMHKGKAVKVKVLESYIAPTDFSIEKRTVKKGSWVLVTRINDKKLWKDIKEGKFTGYSMAGYAKVA